MTNILAPFTKQQYFLNNGAFNAAGSVFTYAAGSSVPIATYTATGATNANPVILDSRGSCDIWLIPNVGYKFNVTDSSGNTLPGYPVDNIFLPQLLTLFAGVDTGSANNYIVNFVANFTSLTNGIVLYFIASNSNTGFANLTVNNFGTQQILNQSGMALGPGQILGGQVTGVIYFNGNWLLLSTAAPYSSTFPVTYVGGTVNPAGTVNYTVNGTLVTLFLPYLSDTSTSTSFSYSGLPASLQPTARYQLSNIASVIDNGTRVFGAVVQVGVGDNNIHFFNTNPDFAWTASGQKSCGFQLGSPAPTVYQNSFTYSLV